MGNGSTHHKPDRPHFGWVVGWISVTFCPYSFHHRVIAFHEENLDEKFCHFKVRQARLFLFDFVFHSDILTNGRMAAITFPKGQGGEL